MKEPNGLTRRQFLVRAGCASLGSTGVLSALLNLGMAAKMAASDLNDYKAMVCVFLLGGNDSYNVLAPANRDEYRYYLDSRGGLYDVENNPAGLALAAPGEMPGSLLPIQPVNLPGRGFGIHPAMPDIKRLFDAKALSFVANVGSLQKPLPNVAAYRNASGDRPLGLFSHSDQQQQWQTCMPDRRSGIGWAGRAMDILQNDQSAGQKSTFNISLSGTNILQTGSQVVPYSMSLDGLVPLKGYALSEPSANASFNEKETYARSAAVKKMMDGMYRNLFETTYARITLDAQDALTQYQKKLDTDAYPQWDTANQPVLEQQLKLVANVISAYRNSPTKRQTFFISISGFDLHHGLMLEHPDVLKALNSALGNFWNHLSADLKPAVTLFTASDFGRTLSGNGSGADHGWGGNQIVMGGAVQGGRIFGTYPTFAPSVIETTYDVGQGRLIPGFSVEEYVYPILRWFGVSDSDLFGAVFPGYTSRFGSGGIRASYPLYG
ncbi:MAG TPA: DUF1501 domain-containing protein [Chthoniobacterales bacterium]